jgi:hypothetical protein
MKITRNFSFEKLRNSQALSEWLNQYGNRIHKSIQDGLDSATDIHGRRFTPGGTFTHKSIQDGQAHKRPLVRSGRLKNSLKKLPATINKLSFVIKSNLKSKKRWNIEVDGSKSRGTRDGVAVNYGALHNKGYKTSSNSMIPNKNVEQREWFGIPSTFIVGGSEWEKMKGLLYFYLEKYTSTPMKEHK